MGKEMCVYTHSGILVSLKKDVAICNNMNETENAMLSEIIQA